LAGSASTHVTDSSAAVAAASRLQPYRANTSDLLAGGTSALTGAQFAAFDSMYKAYQGAYAQGAGSAGLYGPQSMRYDPLLHYGVNRFHVEIMSLDTIDSLKLV